MKPGFIIFACCFLLGVSTQAQGILLGTVVSENQPVAGALIKVSGNKTVYTSDSTGKFEISLSEGNYILVITHINREPKRVKVDMRNENQSLRIDMDPQYYQLSDVVIEDENAFSSTNLLSVSDMGIYAAKKSEVIQVSNVVMNTTANNSRQLYARVPGLNIWESDGAGLQLGIGARGLSPDRTSNFNTRQNGYDISADALGYPESYYTPPAEAIEKIEIVRGAAGLQFGTQFGGLLNFKLKKGPSNTPFEWTGKAGYGLYNLFSLFNSFGGETKHLNYYAYYQYKRGDGWRPNSDFNLHNAYTRLRFAVTEKFAITLEYTFMHYLAHQPGGLTDAQFQQNPRQSNRARNWFRIGWNLPAITFDIKLGKNTELNLRNFALIANRDAVGILEKINVADLGGNRMLMTDDYLNFGNETRILHRYKLGKSRSAFVAGIRLYRGSTHRLQGDGSSGSGPDFAFVHPDSVENSDYRFVANNVAAFAENVFVIHPKFSITPGFRIEWIQTTANGYYIQTVKDGAGNIISSVKTNEVLNRSRPVFLAGLGLSYKPSESLELYANFSQNYRAITYNDLRVVNPNFKVDSALQDEKGFNADIGFRGTIQDVMYFDASGFMLYYANRIGLVLKSDEPPLFTPYRLRTNVADSWNMGVEAYVEADLLRIGSGISTKYSLSVFFNGSYINARYYNSSDASINGRLVELVPQFNGKAGITFRWKTLSFAWQTGYTTQQYADATNAAYVANAVSGIIPAYWVMDFSSRYTYKWLTAEAGVNNFTNNLYFTRRATGYPGPGIIPSDGITFYLALQVKLAARK